VRSALVTTFFGTYMPIPAMWVRIIKQARY
jgi:hypothetical protein